MMTRQEALDKSASHMEEAGKTMGDVNLGKHLSLAQLYLSYAHEVGLKAAEESLRVGEGTPG
jgi:hypothetical protein